MKTNRRIRLFKAAITALPVIAFLLALVIGRYELSLGEILRLLISPDRHADSVAFSILFELRLPRAVLGILTGGILAASGAGLQGMFKNPLVDSGMLGVSSGAGFGAVLGILLFGSQYMVTMLFAFGFGLLAVGLSYMVGTIYKSSPQLMLVLGGVIVSSLFSSLISMGKFVADPFDQLPSIVFWLMGSMANAGFEQVLYAAVPILISAAGLSLMGWRINVLSLGDREAHSLGVPVPLTKALVVLFCSLGTAAAVSLCGTIGWVGLVIPHVVRMLLGSDNKAIIPYSFLLGGGFLALIDIVARSATTAELPVGMLTAFIGVPFYIFLLRKTRGGGW